MEHVKALIIKFVMIAVVLGIILTGFFDVSLTDSLLISVVLTILAYIAGDLLIFRTTGDRSDQGKRNLIATISDAVLAFLVIWFMGNNLVANDSDIITASIISALVIAAGEWFFHKYLDSHVFGEKHRADAY
ncbi:YndM family protein [Bacillus infantis]|uniref:YndM family protein n=1 Tax=Bacillus infantis TaxID=324767 RepID=UPI001CD49361|nr:YndM family protein [Bacillus infantis]MCA1042275.1 YndM family protein [Bacillus infantis]